MPRCLLLLDGADHDVSNLVPSEYEYLPSELTRCCSTSSSSSNTARRRRSLSQSHDKKSEQEVIDWSVPLYPNLQDPCNKRLIEDVESANFEIILQREPSSAVLGGPKWDEYYQQEQAQQQMLQSQQQAQQHQQQEQSQEEGSAYAGMTSIPRRAQTAPLHAPPVAYAPTSPSSPCALSLPAFSPAMSNNNVATTSRRSISSFQQRPQTPQTPRTPRQHRHSASSVPTSIGGGDINSSSGGLRPRVNYKALYGGGGGRRNTALPTLRTSITSSSCAPTEDAWGSSRSSLNFDPFEEETPVPEFSRQETSSLLPHEDHQDQQPQPTTMEIAPNVRVPVRSSQESFKAVQSGHYTVVTCFACCSTLVCTLDAAYVLCPDCQIVSPLGYNNNNSSSSSSNNSTSSDDTTTKKDKQYGVGTGLKREWVTDLMSS